MRSLAFSMIGLSMLFSAPAQAALLVNWTTGEYREVGWEVCYVAAQNNPDYQCFGGLNPADGPLGAEETKDAVEKFAGAIPPEPTSAEAQKIWLGNHNTARSNKSTVAPGDGDVQGTGADSAEPSERSSPANINTSRSNTKGVMNSDTELSVGQGRNTGQTAATPSDNTLPINDKRKCIKAGGAWVTNSLGSFCLRALR